MDTMLCPNCGHHLKAFRTERQAAGHRVVRLQWAICECCHHVALHEWSFIEDEMPQTQGGAEKWQGLSSGKSVASS